MNTNFLIALGTILFLALVGFLFIWHSGKEKKA